MMTALCREWPRRCRAVLASLALCLFAGLVSAQGLPSTVRRVIDGDQLVVRGPGGGEQSIRMAGINAPGPGQPYAEQSRSTLAEALTGRFVVVDVYGRTGPGQFLGRVTFGGEDMNLAQVEQGLARVDPQTLAVLSAQDQRRYLMAEAAAQRSGRGLWGEPGTPQPGPGGFGHDLQ